MWKLFTVGELDQRKIDIYTEMLQKPTSEADVNQIDLDINRTLRNHVNYKQRYGKGLAFLIFAQDAIAAF